MTGLEDRREIVNATSDASLRSYRPQSTSTLLLLCQLCGMKDSSTGVLVELPWID